MRLFIETNTTQAKALDEWTCPVDRHLSSGYHRYHDTSVNTSSTVAHNDIIFSGFNEKDMTSAKESVRLMFVHYLLILACSLLVLTLVLSILVYYCMLVLPHTSSTTVKIEV